MKSIWKYTTKLKKREPLAGDYNTDVAIIGGGMAGLLTAYWLKKRGVSAVVLEAGRIASGQTGNTTAKITSQHGAIYQKLLDDFGEQKARQYVQANEQAIHLYEQIIRDGAIDCDFVRCPSYLYSVADRERIRQETQAAKKLGLAARQTRKTELSFAVAGAMVLENQARFDPLRFLQAVSEPLTIFENTMAEDVQGTTVITNCGKVSAKKVVFACHDPFLRFEGAYFMRMYQQRSYVLALTNTPAFEGMYYGIDPDAAWSIRPSKDALLFGGAGHRTGENRLGGRYDTLRQKAREFWPQSEEVAHFSAQDGITLDGIPYIGEFSTAHPDWYIAMGFGKWGMTHSMVAATLITDMVCGKKNPYRALFSPERFTPAASSKEFVRQSAHAVRDISRELFGLARASVENLAASHGGIVEVEGEKVGVYRDEEGAIHAVSTRCPHFGCQLEWNPDEKSWDCPCHGSRFDFHGKRLCGPALQNLSYQKL